MWGTNCFIVDTGKSGVELENNLTKLLTYTPYIVSFQKIFLKVLKY